MRMVTGGRLGKREVERKDTRGAGDGGTVRGTGVGVDGSDHMEVFDTFGAGAGGRGEVGVFEDVAFGVLERDAFEMVDIQEAGAEVVSVVDGLRTGGGARAGNNVAENGRDFGVSMLGKVRVKGISGIVIGCGLEVRFGRHGRESQKREVHVVRRVTELGLDPAFGIGGRGELGKNGRRVNRHGGSGFEECCRRKEARYTWVRDT